MLRAALIDRSEPLDDRPGPGRIPPPWVREHGREQRRISRGKVSDRAMKRAPRRGFDAELDRFRAVRSSSSRGQSVWPPLRYVEIESPTALIGAWSTLAAGRVVGRILVAILAINSSPWHALG